RIAEHRLERRQVAVDVVEDGEHGVAYGGTSRVAVRRRGMPDASAIAASTSARIARSERDATSGSARPSTCTYVRLPSPRSSESSGTTAKIRSARTNFP